MEARASAKYLRGSAQKARLVVDMIRGKRLAEALAILQFTNKRAAAGIEKCLRSAWANANEAAERNNVSLDPDDIFVKACYVDMGPTKHRRRVRPAPQGRAYREQRHFCHVTVLVASEEKEVARKGRGKAATGKETKADAKKASAAGSKGKSAAAGRKGGATKKAAGSSEPAEKTTTKRASKKTEAAPSEETKE